MPNTTTTTRQIPRRRLRWLAVAAIAAVSATVSNAATAGAQDDTAEPVDIAVTSYASDYSVTHEEAQRRLDRIQPLQDILAEIRSHETARLAGWGIDHTGDLHSLGLAHQRQTSQHRSHSHSRRSHRRRDPHRSGPHIRRTPGRQVDPAPRTHSPAPC